MVNKLSFQSEYIKTEDLFLDPDNPRFFELRELKGKKALSQDELHNEIEKDDDIISLLRAIRKDGVKDPIWVKPVENGKYLVIEGNRRTHILTKLLREKIIPPKGVRYDTVPANILSKDTDEKELLLQRIRLQAGKKEWGAFNEAVATYELRNEHLLDEEDIATELQISRKKVKDRINNYNLFIEFTQTTKVTDPRKFAFFTDTPKKVRNWIEKDENNKKTFYKLIMPLNGVQKIRSVATKGGLRDFEKILDRPQILEQFLNSPRMTVEDAFELLKEEDITEEVDVLKKIDRVSEKLNALDEEQVDRIKKDKNASRKIKRLYKACQSILLRVGENIE